MGSDSSSAVLGLAVLVTPLLAYYILVCWKFPYRTCRHCKGGKVTTRSGLYWGNCRHCAGKGGHLRAGRRIWDVFH